MIRKLVVSEAAEQDIIDVALWYARIRVELALKFLDNLELAIDFIEQYPESLRLRESGYRALSIKKFPYQVAYLIRDDQIEIVAVMHQKRDPQRIIERLRNK